MLFLLVYFFFCTDFHRTVCFSFVFCLIFFVTIWLSGSWSWCERVIVTVNRTLCWTLYFDLVNSLHYTLLRPFEIPVTIRFFQFTKIQQQHKLCTFNSRIHDDDDDLDPNTKLLMRQQVRTLNIDSSFSCLLSMPFSSVIRWNREKQTA